MTTLELRASLLRAHPLLEDVAATREVFWVNPDALSMVQALPTVPLGPEDVRDAALRLERFRPYLAEVFPETAPAGGLIESPLKETPTLREALAVAGGGQFPGRLFAKLDSQLPISGSIKARGGIYEILKLAETVALSEGLLARDGDYAQLASNAARELFGGYSVAVGSTGNLGLSIGIMSAALGFKVTVHMSADARQWKKDMLRSKGVRVVEHASDYSLAVAEGRREAESDPRCHFVDDENSQDLFLGYAVAGERLKAQFDELGVAVDAEHPLHVYLPCGVGGGPGGVTLGLKLAFGDAVRCWFAEPTHAPAMLLGLCTGMHETVSVQDLGLDVRTAADGLAVGRPSGFVGRALKHLIDGVFTVDDDALFRHLSLAARTEGLRLEPSAVAGLSGACRVAMHGAAGAAGRSAGATHLFWATGGGMVPDKDWNEYDARGRGLIGE
ncbi:D-serine ammonia-lyase [Desulfocurvus sp. DL9XJH121]